MWTVSWVGHMNVTNKMTGSRQLSDTTITSHPNRTCLQLWWYFNHLCPLLCSKYAPLNMISTFIHFPYLTMKYQVPHPYILLGNIWIVFVSLVLSSFSFNCTQSQIYKPFSAIINLYDHQHLLWLNSNLQANLFSTCKWHKTHHADSFQVHWLHSVRKTTFSASAVALVSFH